MALATISYQTKRSFRVLASVVMMVAVAIGAGLGVSRVFTLRRVEVVGSGVQIELDKTALPQNLLFFPTKQLEQQILHAYPLVADVRFEKRFPDTLIVRVTLREGLALLVTGSQTYVLDETGVVLGNATADARRYPRLQFDLGTLAIGRRLDDPRIQQSLTFVRNVKDTLVIDGITQQDSATLQATMGSTNIFLPQNSDMREKATTLQTIIEGFRIKGTLPTVIDLRFEKPIITK